MRRYRFVFGLAFVLCSTRTPAQTMPAPPSHLPVTIEVQGFPLKSILKPPNALGVGMIDNRFPTENLLRVSQIPSLDSVATSRSAEDAEIYRTISPSVVLIATKDELGSGSLVSASGHIVTSWHVVAGYDSVAIVFKPAVEGAKPGPDDMKIGHVVKIDELADLALVKAEQVPIGRTPIRLGDEAEIAVGSDVLAIGHPVANEWSLTKGIISQYRRAYEWTYDDQSKHKADAIQTQTPINPGNSGGPLLSELGSLLGVNAAKVNGEGINYAVSVGEVKRFFISASRAQPVKACQWKELSIFRSNDNKSGVISYDLDCSGKADANYIVPDRKADPIMLTWDRKGNGRPDVIFFDFKRRGKWDLSYWDANFEGKWTIVGYHDDGSLRPSRFESYESFQKRLAAQR